MPEQFHEKIDALQAKLSEPTLSEANSVVIDKVDRLQVLADKALNSGGEYESRTAKDVLDGLTVLLDTLSQELGIASPTEIFESHKDTLKSVLDLAVVSIEVAHKMEIFRQWFDSKGWRQGEDYVMFDKIISDDGTIVRDFRKTDGRFALAVKGDKYSEFIEYIQGEFSNRARSENPDTKIDVRYSWGGRIFFADDSVAFDSVMFSDGGDFKGMTESKDGAIPMDAIPSMQAPTYHKEYMDFFRDRMGFELPTAEVLITGLQKIAEEGLADYEKAFEKISDVEKGRELTEDEYQIKMALIRYIALLKGVETPKDLPPNAADMDSGAELYCDLTYNIYTEPSLDRIEATMGVRIPDRLRVDKIFDIFSGRKFDRDSVAKLNEDFAKYLSARK
ncbi:hypothetical protein HN748_04840 [Candidatus Peregrinibacteria bacterium]|nr:hypothetical protein [Candidatus Peregrinibacteria bacterium]